MPEAEAFSACAGRADAMRLFVREAPMTICLLDRQARALAASPSFLRDFKLSAPVTGRSLFEIVPGAEADLEAARLALAAGEPRHVHLRQGAAPDGGPQWWRAATSLWRDDAGAVGGYLMMFEDVTAEQLTTDRLRESESLLQAVIDHVPAPLTVQDFDTTNFVLVSKRVGELLDLPAAEIIGKPVTILSGDHLGTLSEEPDVSAEGQPPTTIMRRITTGPHAGQVQRVKRLIFKDNLGRKRVLSIGADVTELRDASEALERALADAEAANQAKSRFLANVSHEIRTPLNGVLGMAQAMAYDELPDAQRARLDIVRESGEALLAILNDLLDLTKIEAGKLELETTEFQLDDLVRGACATFQALADHKGLGLRLDMKAEPDACRGDPTRLRQVLSNLISNALKFTERGHVEIGVRRRGELVEFTVRDTGLGMAPDTVERMFDKFSQGDVSTTRRFGGTGLGLSISRDLVDLMSGRITAASRLGEGSTFVVTVPLPICAAPVRADIAPVAGRDQRLRVLAAEDNAVNRTVLQALLGQLPVDLTMVENGALAVEAWAADHWDVVLMDVQMPVLDGRSAARAIRRREAAAGRPRTPIIALTADAMAHHAAEHLASGMDATVAKPIQLQALVEALDAVLVDEPARQTG